MPDSININELLQVLQAQEQDQNPEESIEQNLMQLILNPLRAQRQRIRIDNNIGDGVIFELREATIINEHGIHEELQELIINPQTFADGLPVNVYGVMQCPNCSSTIKTESIRVCCCCGRYLCTVKGCGYTSFDGRWFCSLSHRIFGIFRKLY